MTKIKIHMPIPAFHTIKILLSDCGKPLILLILFTIFANNIAIYTINIFSSQDFYALNGTLVLVITSAVLANIPVLLFCVFKWQLIRQSFGSGRLLKTAFVIGLCPLALKLTGHYGVPDVGLELSIDAVAAVLTLCLLVPVCEELFFRGFLWARMQAKGRSDGIIITCISTVFIAVHLPDTLWALINYVVMAFSFSLIRYFSGGITLPIFFHGALNFMALRHIGV